MKIKEKIKNSFASCKRKQILSYSEWLTKNNFDDDIYSKHEYEKYKIEIIDYNKTADINISTKIGSIIFAIILVAVLVVLLVQQCSATVYMPDSILENAFTTNAGYIASDNFIYSFNDYNYTFKIYGLASSGVTYTTSFAISDIESFQGLCEYRQIDSYSDFENYVNISYPDYNSDVSGPPLCGYYITSDNFYTILTYKHFTITDIENALSQGYQNGCEDSFETVSNWLQSYVTTYEPYSYVNQTSFVDTLNDNVGRQMTLVAQRNYEDGYNNAIEIYLNSAEYREYIESVKADSYALGLSKGEETAPLFKSGLSAIINAPVNVLSRVLNFDLFGVNLWSFFTVIFTVTLLFFVIKRILGL